MSIVENYLRIYEKRLLIHDRKSCCPLSVFVALTPTDRGTSFVNTVDKTSIVFFNKKASMINVTISTVSLKDIEKT